MQPQKAFVHAPAYAVGPLESIENIVELQQDREVLENMRALGVDTYGRHDGSPFDLARRAIAQSLEKADVSGADLDAVVYVTTAYASTNKPWRPYAYGAEIRELVREFGAVRASPYLISLSQCVNLIAGLQVAANLVLLGNARTVLVFAADCIAEGFSRIVDPKVSVISDAAASCVVTSRPGGYEIERIVDHVDWSMLDLNPEQDFSQYFKRTAEGVKSVCQKLYAAASAQPSDFEQLLTNNVNFSVTRMLAVQSGFDRARIHSENIGRFAHCDSSDVLINLAEYDAAPRAEGSGRVMLLTSAPYMWGAVALQRHA
jgi:3-oxoacyl-[acyl-carrier-protein] synthase III